jgi:hypothetical protein
VDSRAHVNGNGGVIGLGVLFAIEGLGMAMAGLVDIIDDPSPAL